MLLFNNFLIILMILVNPGFSSKGDQLIVFNGCLQTCSSTCPSSTQNLDFFLRLTNWNCLDNCKYECMHKVTDEAVVSGSTIYQYYGKWPFYRLWGMQEPASVLFSICNGYMHYRGLRKYTSRITGKGYQLRPIVVAYGIVAINTWIWSSVFHTRDLPITEKLDYFSAMLGLLTALYYGIHRIFTITYGSRLSLTLLLTFFGFYLYHTSYLTFYKFDYGYNMKASIAVAVAHNLIWLVWSIWNWSRIPHARQMSIVVLSLTATALLEIFDFPAFWRVLDAHSLWHFSTIPCVLLYWRFLLKDSLYELSISKKK